MPGSAQDKNATLNGIKALYDAIQPYLNGGTHAGFTPVGSIIAIMGNEAPTHYLACDGTVYNIVDYAELATYFNEQFGSKNFFGGDGIDTFAVPDLRGEFLRGTGTNSHSMTYGGKTLTQGSGANVGVHQNATVVPHVYTTEGNIIARKQNTTTGLSATLADSAVTSGTYGKIASTNGSSDNTAAFTTRPTNTSVLYCIATKNIFVDVTDFGEAVDAEDIAAIIAEEPPVARNNFQDYSLNEQIVGRWIDGKPIYQKTIDFGALPNNTTKTVNHNISDIDMIVGINAFIHNSTINRTYMYPWTATSGFIAS